MKRVLIITYYWPPAGGGGVMRWLKMSKYLPEWGWQPVICTPENPDPSVIDESLQQEVGDGFALAESFGGLHITPSQGKQSYTFCRFIRKKSQHE